MSSEPDPTALSRTVLIGTVVATVALLVIGLPWPIALIAGVGGFITSFTIAKRSGSSTSTRSAIDPFTLGEPWRQFVQGAQRAGHRLHSTVDSADDGPLKDRMANIAGRLDDGLAEAWEIARRGDEIDDAIRRLDPSALQSKLTMLEGRVAEEPNADLEASIASVHAQLDSTERLQVQADKTADRLRLTQTRLDELVTRAAEVAIGGGDTDAFDHDVDDLVIELEALRLAVEETNKP